MARPLQSILQLAERATKQPARLLATGRVGIVRVDTYPTDAHTTLFTDGLAAIDRTIWRRRMAGFELVASITTDLEVVVERLVDAVIAELEREARGQSHERYNADPPRGVMYNGAYAATKAPHLLFATDLAPTPALAERYRVNDRWVDLLPAITIDDAQLAVYDRSPPRLIDQLRARP